MIHSIARVLVVGSMLSVSVSEVGRAQASIDSYSGFIERRAFHTWSESPRLTGTVSANTDYTEEQVTVVRIAKGKATATYTVTYNYGTWSNRTGAWMDGRCPFSHASADEEVQIFPEQGVPARASLNPGSGTYRLSVMFDEPAVGTRTTKSDALWAYNRGSKGCPDNPDRRESQAKQSLRSVPAIRIEEKLESGQSTLIGSLVTPVSTVNAKPGRIETGWETVRWSLATDGAQCPYMAPDRVQFYRNLNAEITRLEKERNELSRKAVAAGTDGKTPQAEVVKMYEQRNALNSRIRDLAQQLAGSPFSPISGAAISAQAFGSSGCGTKG